MPLVPKLITKLQRHPKRFIFPEGADPRILQAARQIVTRRMGAPVLLGDRPLIKETAARLDLSMEGMRILEPARSDDFDFFVRHLQDLRRDKGLKENEAREAVRDTNYFATLMLATARVDALISGATVSASSALRPLFQIIPRQQHVTTVSSLMILDFEEKKVGEDGVLFFADCGVIPEPSPEQLADIALTTGRICRHLTNALPRVAFLSFASKSSSEHPPLQRVRLATKLAREKARTAGMEMEIDGELQVDAALDPETARMKKVEGPVAGKANVLVFPDLNSGNIGFKLVQFLAGANAYGQILTGLSRPAAEISRGASAHDVFGAAAIVGCQAIDHRLLYGNE